MESITVIMFISVVLPMMLAVYLFEKKSRLVLIFLIVGMFICLICSQLNTALYELFDGDDLFVKTSVSPIIEEVLKSAPIIYFVYVISDKQKSIMYISLAIGLGFSIYENLVIITTTKSEMTILWALARVFGAGLMHSLCSFIVGQCLIFVKKNKKMVVCGVLAMLTVAILYHSIYNCLVHTDFEAFAFLLPVSSYVIMVIEVKRTRKLKRMEKKDEQA